MVPLTGPAVNHNDGDDLMGRARCSRRQRSPSAALERQTRIKIDSVNLRQGDGRTVLEQNRVTIAEPRLPLEVRNN
jgi:hypothetical protein